MTNTKYIDFLKTKKEYLIPLLAVLSLTISSILVSQRKFFWNDELLSFFLITDPSFTHLLGAWADTFNQSPPLYFFLGWFWAKIFGASEMSLRLFSSLTISLALIFVWLTIRRTYNFWATSLATLTVFCLSDVILYHNAETRMYGLFLMVCAIAFYQFDYLNSQAKFSRKSLLINTLIHSSIVLTHLYGLFYSTATLVSFIICDLMNKKWRSPVYLSVIAGWLILIPLIPLLIQQSDNKAKWFSTISRQTFFSYFVLHPNLYLLLLGFTIISAILFILSYLQNQELVNPNDLPNKTNEVFLLIFSSAFFAVPLFTWFITLTIKPILNERYIIPTIGISFSILFAYLLSRLFPDNINPKKNYKLFSLNFRGVILSTIIILLLRSPIAYSQAIQQEEKPGINDDKYGYLNLPIAMEAGHDFLPRFHYANNSDRYFHILDWETAVKNTDSAFATGDYTHLSALKRQYPEINTIESEKFLEKHDRFLVFNENDQKWFEWRIQNSDQYKTQLLGADKHGTWGDLKLFLVEKVK